MLTLRQTIEKHAAQFAAEVLRALRSASLDELMSVTGSKGGGLRLGSGALPKLRGRLGRRTAADIASTLDKIVSVLAQHPEGLRAEQIRAALQLDRREMPKPVAEGLKRGVLTKTGNKRATTYTFVGDAPAAVAAAAPAKKRGRKEKK